MHHKGFQLLVFLFSVIVALPSLAESINTKTVDKKTVTEETKKTDTEETQTYQLPVDLYKPVDLSKPIEMDIQKIETYPKLPESQYDEERRRVEARVNSLECRHLQLGCMRQFTNNGRWRFTRQEVEDCAIEQREFCENFPINHVYFKVYAYMEPPQEAIPGGIGLIPGTIDLLLSCKRERENCYIIFSYQYGNPERKNVITRLLGPAPVDDLDPLPPLDGEEPAEEEPEPEERCLRDNIFPLTDRAYLPHDEQHLMEIPLYGSREGCLLPDHDGCYQEVSSEEVTDWRDCPGDIEFSYGNERWSAPCLLKFDTYQFGFTFPPEATFCYIHLLQPRRLQ